MVFVSDRRMRDLNRQYRGRDYSTDVLSFGYASETEGGVPFLGEIVIAPSVAWRQALLWRTHPDGEIRKLLLHGILHLRGFDHETDDGEMTRLQRRLLRRRALSGKSPVIEMRKRA